METSPVSLKAQDYLREASLLVRETNEMETRLMWDTTITVMCPYSLGKLMKWKPTVLYPKHPTEPGPYSLGKLMKWKRVGGSGLLWLPACTSLLVRETNEMET